MERRCNGAGRRSGATSLRLNYGEMRRLGFSRKHVKGRMGEWMVEQGHGGGGFVAPNNNQLWNGM